jgi:sigma-B regulation protein RsbU (phosphoserine phosphatase)
MAEHELGMVSVIRAQREALEAKSRLLEAQRQLAHELAEAAAHVESLLPARLERPIRTDWQFVSSSALGGDFFGYRWLDEHRFAIYLLDVMGHGVGAALLSTSVESALRGNAVTALALDDPAAVIRSLNRAFLMEQNGGRFFTMWYGIYDVRDRSLVYANAGHPPALLFGGGEVARLGATGTMVGIMPSLECAAKRVSAPPNSRLYLYSDGAYEVTLPTGRMLDLAGLEAIIVSASAAEGSRTAEVVRLVRAAQGKAEFGDDVLILEVEFA